MEKRLALVSYDKQLWTREKAQTVRAELNKLLDSVGEGSSVIIDAKGVEVFDYSFANELFGKSLLNLANEFPGRFLVVENLSAYTRENLIKALESLNIAMIERTKKGLDLIGKIHAAYLETFRIVSKSKSPVSANAMSEKLDINITAANERLTKLVGFGLIRREKATSVAGREQYVYATVN